MTKYIGGTEDPYRARMTEARNSPAVIKAKIVSLRTYQPDVVVLAFEGVDDKIIYAHWMNRLRPALCYEPFLCDGKTGVLDLIEIIKRDQGGDTNKIYCFVDRDFDDLRSSSPHEKLFMTNCYSVENMLVSQRVLESLLINEFNCHGELEAREEIQKIFAKTYSQFLEGSKEANWRLFVVRKMSMRTAKPLPEKLSSLISHTLDEAVLISADAKALIEFEFEPSPEELAALRPDFDRLAPEIRYRGKWALKFFESWLRMLEEEYKAAKLGLFKKINTAVKVRSKEIGITSFAAKSSYPDGLREFVNAIEN